MQIETERLADAVKKLRPLWSDDTPTSVPSSQHVAFREKDGILTLSAVNDAGWKVFALSGCSISEEFSMDGRELQRILKRVPSEEVIVEPLTTNVRFKSENGNFSVKRRGRWEGYLVELDKAPDDLESSNSQALEAASLMESIERVRYATGGEEARQFCQGVHFLYEDDQLRVAATDGRKTAYEYVDLPSVPDILQEKGDPLQDGFLLPKDSLDALLTLGKGWHLSNLDPELWIRDQKSGLIVRPMADSITFPDIDSLMPNPTAGEKMAVDRKALQSALKAVEISVDDSARRIHLDLRGEDLVLRTGEHEEGAGEYKMPEVEIPEIDDVVAYNIDYILGAVQSYDCETVDLYLTDMNGRLLFVLTPAGDESRIRTVSPMRTEL